ncbi:hypothetical protein QBC42DRAFT_263624 [Cladorrhinum samala]|uniref:Transmembrane protein n=1 Tax=Cladorrhinum samala TaxID=585594 RepID=A0AAV9HTZ4_9PEZI|nr:hypothetical protein QBC42DRAFT_263624 [Cladorrhinum samala]
MLLVVSTAASDSQPPPAAVVSLLSGSSQKEAGSGSSGFFQVLEPEEKGRDLVDLTAFWNASIAVVSSAFLVFSALSFLFLPPLFWPFFPEALWFPFSPLFLPLFLFGDDRFSFLSSLVLLGATLSQLVLSLVGLAVSWSHAGAAF